jgi:hypothetical protein
MASTQGSALKKAVEQAAAKAAVKPVTQQATLQKPEDNPKFKDISSNTFTKIVFDPKVKAKDKVQLVAQALAIDETKSKEENLARLEEFTLFKEFMQEKKTEQSMAVILATDPTVFGALQEMIDNMTTRLDAFGKGLDPLMEALDGIHTLHEAGYTSVYEAVQEMRAEEEAQEKRNQEIELKLQDVQQATRDRDNLTARIENIQTGKKDVNGDKFRGLFGGLKANYEAEIKLTQETKIPAAQAELDRLAEELQTLRAKPLGVETKFDKPELAEAKRKLRDMLNVSSPEHQARQQALIDAAANFVVETATQSKSTLDYYGKLDNKLQTIDTNNTGTRRVYDILTEATVEVNKKNETLRKKYDAAPEGVEESPLDKSEREDKKTEISQHISAMTNSALDTARVSAELVKEAGSLATAKEKTSSMINRTRAMRSSGTASMASSLATTLTSINAAAINESSAVMENSMSIMDDKTAAVSVSAAVSSAMGMRHQNEQMAQMIEQLRTIGEGYRATQDQARSEIAAALEHKKELYELVSQVGEVVKENKGVVADAVAAFTAAHDGAPQGTNDNKAAGPAKPAAAKPAFDFSKV